MAQEFGIIDYTSYFGIILFVVISTGWFLYSKKQRKKSIIKACNAINEPSISVLSVRWNDRNFTFVIIFENNRLLFIRPEKIQNDSKNFSHDELLKMDKMNYVIPFEEISKIKLKKTTMGVNAGRSGKIIIHSSKKQSFDILEQESFEKCEEILRKFLPNKLEVI